MAGDSAEPAGRSGPPGPPGPTAVPDAERLGDAASDEDPATGLRAVAALHRLADRLETLQVRNARFRGWSWEQIGHALGVSKQAVHKKHGRK